MSRIDYTPVEWIAADGMTEQEKVDNPKFETTGGYLKKRDTSECCNEWWKELTEKEKKTIQEIPNFNSEKFYIITGIRV